MADLLRLLSDDPNERYDVVETAVKLIRQRVAADSSVLADLLSRISVAELSVKLLDGLLAIPLEIKSEHSAELWQLLFSPHARVRMAIIRALPQGWLGNEDATEAARSALGDDDPSVRNAALQVLRRLQNER